MFKGLLGRRSIVRFRRETWVELISELARRGGGVRESGAFLLADALSDGRTVTAIVYFDDLDPASLTGGVALYGPAFGRLWSICAERSLRVVGDVHTHPGPYTQQSCIDRRNPMVARVGHVAIIVPSLARGEIEPADVGVHLYGGDAGWNSSFGRAATDLVYVGRWA